MAGVPLLLLMAQALSLSGRTNVAVREGWAAFADQSPHRCYAIAEPVRGPRPRGWRPYLSVGFWPAHDARPQIQARLSRKPADGAPVTLAIGDRRFALVAGGADAWTADPRQDFAITTAMRGAPSLSIESRAQGGGAFADGYALVGAPTAIDAAAVACAVSRIDFFRSFP